MGLFIAPAAWAWVAAASVGGGVVGAALLWRGRPARAVLCLLAGLGVGFGAVTHRPPPYPDAVARALTESAAEVGVEGVWLRTFKAGAGPTGARGLIDTTRIAASDIEARVAVTLTAGQVAPLAGDVVRFAGRLSPPRGLANPGMPDAGWLARAQGIELTATIARGSRIHVVAPGAAWAPRRLAERAHLAMARAIDRAVAPPRAAFIKALVLGERSAAGPEVEAGFKAAGAVHALSVSGLHLTAIAGLVFFLFRRSVLWFPRLALRLRPDAIAAALSIPTVLLYCALTGEAVATRRAALMAALALGALTLGRLPSLPSAIGAAALTLLLDSPLLVIDPSFQLSFASVIALALVSESWSMVADEPWWKRAGIWCIRGLLVSAAAFLATAPLSAHHFAEVAPLSPLGNLILVPPVELGIVPLGLFGAGLAAWWPPLGMAPLWIADGLTSVVLWLAEGFRMRAPLLPVPSPDGIETASWFLSAVLALAGRRAIGDLRLVAWFGAGLAGVVGSAHFGYRAYAAQHRDNVVVTFLDVGQGDAALIEGPAGFVALIDGGGNVDGGFDPGVRVIEPLLRRKIISRVDLVVLSHPHPDHMNGLLRIFERFTVGTLWTSGDGKGDATYDRLIALAAGRGTRIEAPTFLRQGGLVFEPLAPFVGERIAPPPGLGANDASVVLRMSFGGRRILFTGDIESQGEAELLGRHAAAALRSDVLKVPHHGSRTSSSDELLAAVVPDLAVASLGWRNRFHFPRPEIVDRYHAHGVPLYRTDGSGALTVEITQAGILRTTCVRSCR